MIVDIRMRALYIFTSLNGALEIIVVVQCGRMQEFGNLGGLR
jgi:hypothetical protein